METETAFIPISEIGGRSITTRPMVETAEVLKPRRVALVELPASDLVTEEEGGNLLTDMRGVPKGSKAYLVTSLRDGGFQTKIFDMSQGDEVETLGKIQYLGETLTKRMRGNITPMIENIVRERPDVVGMTVNYLRDEEIACIIIKRLSKLGLTVVVGGSNALARPEPYLKAGAKAVVLNKSGSTNTVILEDLLSGRLTSLEPAKKESPDVAILNEEGKIVKLCTDLFSEQKSKLKPNDARRKEMQVGIPNAETLKECLGDKYWEEDIEAEFLPIGSLMADFGCDRRCTFCLTPSYGAYQVMSAEHVFRWAQAYKEAGAKSLISISDQFLGRVLLPGGRQEVIDICNGLRELGLPILWGNGLEIRKMTKSRGLGVQELGTKFIRDRILGQSLRPEDMVFAEKFRALMGHDEVRRVQQLVEQAEAEARAEEDEITRKRIQNGGQNKALYQGAVRNLIEAGEKVELDNNEPDGELIDAVYGWDPVQKVGCRQGYTPGERPLKGTKGFQKLLPPEDHMQVLERIVRAGVPSLTYGVIWGFTDDTAEDADLLIEYLNNLQARLKGINPNLKFVPTVFSLRPIPGTVEGKRLEREKRIAYRDNTLEGGFYTPVAGTDTMSSEEVTYHYFRIRQAVCVDDQYVGSYSPTGLEAFQERFIKEYEKKYGITTKADFMGEGGKMRERKILSEKNRPMDQRTEQQHTQDYLMVLHALNGVTIYTEGRPLRKENKEALSGIFKLFDTALHGQLDQGDILPDQSESSRALSLIISPPPANLDEISTRMNEIRNATLGILNDQPAIPEDLTNLEDFLKKYRRYFDNFYRPQRR